MIMSCFYDTVHSVCLFPVSAIPVVHVLSLPIIHVTFLPIHICTVRLFLQAIFAEISSHAQQTWQHFFSGPIYLWQPRSLKCVCRSCRRLRSQASGRAFALGGHIYMPWLHSLLAMAVRYHSGVCIPIAREFLVYEERKHCWNVLCKEQMMTMMKRRRRRSRWMAIFFCWFFLRSAAAVTNSKRLS